MEEQVATLLAALQKPSTPVDHKLQLFTNLKSGIKHNRVPDSCQAPIFECVRIAITTSTSASLVSTGFSTLSHLIKRLVLQNQTSIITSQLSKLLPVLLERLGDARESHRNAASSVLADLWPLSHAPVEELIREQAMKGPNARAKEASMQWVVKMNKTESLPFRAFVPLLLANLEDADPGVRETAKTAVVELFRNAPEHAKANVKKQLVQFNVRKTIASYINSQLDNMASEADTSMAPPPPRPISVARAQSLQPDTGIADEIAPPAEVVPMDPIHIYTQRELDEIFRQMAPHFEGKENEQNWLPRDKSVLKLRRITKGNAPTEFHAAFIAGIKSILDGILKVANTLRTTMSTNGCQLIQELAKTLGPAMDPWVEILLQNFIKMCGATKNIASQNGNTTVDAIFSNVTYNTRVMNHVAFASQDKNVQPRIYAAGWVKTLIRKHKSPIEHHGGMDILEKTLKRGLTDANPKVREAYRSTYWTFALVWPQKAQAIFDTLEKREKNGLEKDPNNPNASLASSKSSAAPSFSKSVGTGSAAAARSSALKEKIAEQRRAKLAASKERPMSAQASYSPPKSQSSKNLGSRVASNVSVASSGTARPPSALGSSTKSVLGASTTGTGSLMSGTVRRPIRRPELARPATADPYASRRPGKVTPSMTPEKTPAPTVKKSVDPKSTVRARAQTQNSPSISPVRSKSRIGEPPSHASTHKNTPSTSSRHGSPAVSPAKDEDLTMVKPFVRSQSHQDPGVIPFRQRNGMDMVTSVDSDVLDLGDDNDDNFTMVIPNLARPVSQPAQRTPPKPVPSPSRLAVASPRASMLKSPKSMGDIHGLSLSSSRSPRMRSPDRPSTRGNDAQEEVQVYEDPFVGDEPEVPSQGVEKPVLEELPLNEKNLERRNSVASSPSDTIMGNTPEDRPRGHHKTASTGSVMLADNGSDRSEVLKNRQLLTSGINKIRSRTVEAHMFRRLQDMVRSNQDIWGADDEKFGELLLASLEYLEAPAETLKAHATKVANLKVQALATIRAMLSLYRKETAKYFSRVLCTILQTKAQYENTSHIAMDLEATADEIVKYGQTSDCLNAVLSLIEDSPSTPSSSPNSNSSAESTSTPSNRTITMALNTLASLIQISGAKNVQLSGDQTARLGRLAVRCLDDIDADVRKADVEVCIALHERIGGEKQDFWKVVAGAREQHLNLLTYYLAKRGKA